MKFSIGDRVTKKAGHGFVGEPLTCVIPDVSENHELGMPCFCPDKNCREWPTLWVIDHMGRTTGAVYHVGECGMELLERKDA